MTCACTRRALEAQLEVKDAAIADARGGKNADKPAGSPTASGGSERGALPVDTPEDLDRLVKDWLSKVWPQAAQNFKYHKTIQPLRARRAAGGHARRPRPARQGLAVQGPAPRSLLSVCWRELV